MLEYLAVSFLIESGVTNVAWVSAIGWMIADRLRPGWKPAPRFIRLWLGVMAVGVGFDVFLSLYRSYVVPRDVLQDLVSAQQFMAGRTMYPADMNVQMRAAMEREGPRRSLLTPWPALAERERRQAELSFSEHWVQAHTPFASLFVVPFLWLGGGLWGAQVLLAVLTVTAFAGALAALFRTLIPAAQGWQLALLALGAFGWDATLVNLRTQNWSMLLGAMVVGSWYFLRRGIPSTAGVLVGLATNLKLIPGVVFLPLILSHRRAAAWAIGSTLVLGLLTLWAVSANQFRAFAETVRGVTDEYAGFPTNISLFAVIVRCGGFGGERLGVARALWFAIGVCVAVGFALAVWTAHRRGIDRQSLIDAEYGLASALMPILSPIAWADYLGFATLPLALLLAEQPRSHGKFPP